MNKNGFISYEERIEIEKALNSGKGFSAIARSLNRAVSTIKREIQRNSFISYSSGSYLPFNNCANRDKCKLRKTRKRIKCKDGLNNMCNTNTPCKDFKELVCEVRLRYPFVCNGCQKIMQCSLTKTFYYAKEADFKSKERISESRKGIRISPEELCELDLILSNLISEKNHSPAIAALNNPDMIKISPRTVYTYINMGVLSVKNIDLPLKVRYRPRKGPFTKKVESDCRKERSYDEFTEYINTNPTVGIVEMDTVEGIKGGSCLLTLYFRNCGLQLAFLRESNNSYSVTCIFDNLYNLLGHDDFTKLFQAVLTDNGSEFSAPKLMENYRILNDDNEVVNQIKRLKVFYCDAGNPTQKPGCERNHEFIRKIIPKGRTFNKYNQFDIDLMMNHINSYKRKKINYQCPADLFIFIYGKTIANKLGIKVINPNEVNLTPTVFK